MRLSWQNVAATNTRFSAYFKVKPQQKWEPGKPDMPIGLYWPSLENRARKNETVSVVGNQRNIGDAVWISKKGPQAGKVVDYSGRYYFYDKEGESKFHQNTLKDFNKAVYGVLDMQREGDLAEAGRQYSLIINKFFREDYGIPRERLGNLFFRIAQIEFQKGSPSTTKDYILYALNNDPKNPRYWSFLQVVVPDIDTPRDYNSSSIPSYPIRLEEYTQMEDPEYRRAKTAFARGEVAKALQHLDKAKLETPILSDFRRHLLEHEALDVPRERQFPATSGKPTEHIPVTTKTTLAKTG